MGKQYKNLTLEDINFIKEQKLFYLASCSTKEVNLSPKGYDSIRVIDNQTLAFANLPGSGNRTHRDSVENGEMLKCENVQSAELLKSYNSTRPPLYIYSLFCRKNQACRKG